MKNIHPLLKLTVSNYSSSSRIINNIDAQVLDIARKHQKDRASKIDAHATFNFTEGWSRKQVAAY
jgi:hypothetical protein